jgi:hypothetical protein
MNPWMPVGAVIVCFGYGLCLLHQETVGPRPSYFLSYAGMAVATLGGFVFVAGAMLAGS